MKKINFIFLVLLAFSFSACENYFGDKTDISFIDKPEFQQRQVAYVPIFPILDNFVKPTDILAGFDELLYVADAGTDEIYSLDESGRILGSFKIPNIQTITQDRQLNLLATATVPFRLNEQTTLELACLYRISLYDEASGNYGIKYAKILDTILHPFYYKSSVISSDTLVRFGQAAVLEDNGYYLTRTGPNNNPFKSGGPDDAVLLFSNQDQYITPITVSVQNGGNFNNYFKQPNRITTYLKPPQISARGAANFIIPSVPRNDPNADAIRFIDFLEGENGAQYSPKSFIQDTSAAESFINLPGRFGNPSGITITGDGTNLIFITDTEKDSLYIFSNNGYEGIKPPPASNEEKYIIASFGGTGLGATNFRNPMAVAYNRKIVYVADTDNGRILRFKLTLDFD